MSEQTSTTKKFKTPVDEHEVEIRLWLTARQRRDIDGILRSQAKLDEKGKAVSIGASILDEMQDKLLQTMIVSVDGNKDDILNRVLELKETDFNFIVKEINEVTESSEEKKSE